MAKILLVEDDKSLREIYGVRLQAEGYEIVSAGDGEEALAMAIKEKPDLIVSDVMMPKISGFDMLDILRSTTETKDIKVIMMTALSSEDQRARGEALGADRYLVKSQVGIEDVVRTVHDVLGDGVAGAAPAANPFSDTKPAPAATPAPATTMPEPTTPPADTTPAPAPQAPTVSEPVTPMATPAVDPTTPPVINMSPMPAPAMPATPAAPEPVVMPAPAPFVPPTPDPMAPSAPAVLPEPTAPFSSPAPASLGDRVINPINPIETEAKQPTDMATQMSQELNTAPMPPAPTLPPQPPASSLPPAPGASL